VLMPISTARSPRPKTVGAISLGSHQWGLAAVFPSRLEDALEKAGIKASAVNRIRLAKGVVGKASYVAASAVAGLALLAWLLHDPRFVLVDAVLIFILFVSYLIGVLWFSNRHPGLALLEGADLIQWRQLEMAAKGLPAAELDEPQQRIASRRGPR